MINNIYAVFDVKAGAYLQPFFMQNNALAIRSFSGACKDTSTMFNAYPEDYTLFQLGSFDDCVCRFTNNDAPIPLGKALDYVSVRSNGQVQMQLADALPVFDGNNSVADEC